MSLCISANTVAKITLHLSIIVVNDTQRFVYRLSHNNHFDRLLLAFISR